jgi:hypothetical protein
MCIDMGVGMLEIAGSRLNDWFFAGKDRKDNDAGGDHSGKMVFEEIGHLEAQLRGVHAKRSLPEGHPLTVDDVYLAILPQKGQLSSRELTSGETLRKAVKKGQAIHIDDIDSQYAQTPSLRKKIHNCPADVNQGCVSRQGDIPPH